MSHSVYDHRYIFSTVKSLIVILMISLFALLIPELSNASIFQPTITQCDLSSEELLATQGNKHVIIVSGSFDNGLGDITYGVESFKTLKKAFPNNKYTLVLYGHESYEEKARKVFGLDQKSQDDYIWLTLIPTVPEEYGSYKEYRAYLEQLTLKEKIAYLKQHQISASEIIKTSINHSEKDNAWNKLTRQASGTACSIVITAAAIKEFDGSEHGVSFLKERGMSVAFEITEMGGGDATLDQETSLELLNSTVLGMTEEGAAPIDSALYQEQFWLTFNIPEEVNEDSEDSENFMTNDGVGGERYLKSYEFGLETAGEEEVLGLMLSEPQKEKASRFNRLNDREKASVRAEFIEKQLAGRNDSLGLKDITFHPQRLEDLLSDGHYFFAYMYKGFSLQIYMSATAPLEDQHRDLHYVINMSEEYRDDVVYKDPLFQQFLNIHDIGTVIYWSQGTLKQTHTDSGKSRILWLVNPFPLTKETLEDLIVMSEHNVAGCTGDHSLYDTISLNKIPFHEDAPHLYGLHEKLAEIAESLGTQLLPEYFRSSDVKLKARHLKNQRINEEWKQLREHFWQHFNGRDNLIKQLQPILKEPDR